MRVIGGRARGRKLRVPPGLSVRPTPDRVREALFSILGEAVAGCRFLDLYAGSGAVGIEALSRGAAEVVFVENAGPSLEALRANLEATGLAAAAEVLATPAGEALARLAGARRGFDLVYADPPYADRPERDRMVRRIAAGGVLEPDGRLILEHPAREPVTPPAPLEPVRQARYGDTSLTFLAVRPSQVGIS